MLRKSPTCLCLIAGLLVAVFTAHVAPAAIAPSFPAGTFVRETAHLVLSSDGSFEVMFDGELIANGHCRIKDDQVVFTDAGGPMACPPDVEGRYKWTFNGKQLIFQVIDDSCDGRVQGIEGQWALQEDGEAQ